MVQAEKTLYAKALWWEGACPRSCKKKDMAVVRRTKGMNRAGGGQRLSIWSSRSCLKPDLRAEAAPWHCGVVSGVTGASQVGCRLGVMRVEVGNPVMR